eukprot:TRINITY_DN5420_c0_g1_i7.p1 TRINITY_DN5420_c0_g1~~TRINITY_DN5420_c0_g1_i7.p1  ORF type:complete len:504 (-),score=125.24 TRINITY_DN5420_c0_g1_i7:652-2163(-)
MSQTSEKYQKTLEQLEQQVIENKELHMQNKCDLEKKDEEISVLEERARRAEEGRMQAEADCNVKLENEKTSCAEQIRQYQTETAALREELSELVDFKLRKTEMEAELEVLRKTVSEERHQHTRALADLERKIVQEKDRLKKDMLAKVKEAKTSLLKMTDEQLTNTTKRTMFENEQMSAELAYQSKASQQILATNQKLTEENNELKRKVAFLEDTEERYAERSSSAQRVIKVLVNKIKALDTMKQEEHNLLEEKKDNEINTLLEELGHRQERIIELTKENERLRHRLGQVTKQHHHADSQEQVISMLSDATSMVLSTLSDVRGTLESTMGSNDVTAENQDIAGDASKHEPVDRSKGARSTDGQTSKGAKARQQDEVEKEATVFPPLGDKYHSTVKPANEGIKSPHKQIKGKSTKQSHGRDVESKDTVSIGIQVDILKSPIDVLSTFPTKAVDAASILEALSSPVRPWGKKGDVATHSGSMLDSHRKGLKGRPDIVQASPHRDHS